MLPIWFSALASSDTTATLSDELAWLTWVAAVPTVLPDVATTSACQVPGLAGR